MSVTGGQTSSGNARARRSVLAPIAPSYFGDLVWSRSRDRGISFSTLNQRGSR